MDNDLQLKNRRIVVTGAASGIGRATIRALAAYGAQLALIDRDERNLAEVARELAGSGANPLHFALDVADEEQVERAFASIQSAWGRIDTVIHSAGIMREQGADIRDISLESWQSVISVNLAGAFVVAKAASRRLIPQKSGTIILVGSVAGVVAASGSIPYGASKGGINGLAMTLQQHLEPHGIRVHNFCPGSVNTPLYQGSLNEGVNNGSSADAAAAVLAKSVDADGVGRALALLASPLADYLKGNIFTR
jgi:NAD(P)-dependent dehydrogenase (short-subunit alcohol dehydrogenase family)